MATKYKILFLNHPKVLINGRLAKVGDTFNEKAVIRWTEERQAMKVMDTATGKRFLMTSKPSEKEEMTAYEILTRNKHLSTHAPGDKSQISDFDLLENSISPEYDLLDEIEIPTNLPVNENHYFMGSYKYGDTTVSKRLEHRDRKIIINKNLFCVGNTKLEPKDVLLTIDYIIKTPSNSVFIKDNISIIVIPMSLKNE